MVFDDRSADRSTELGPLEGRNRAHIEIVQRVELAIAGKLVSAAVNLVCPRPRNRVDHASRGLAIIRLVVAGDDGKFFDRVNSQASSQHAAGCAVRVVIEADSVQAVVILLWASAGNR